MPFHTDAFSRFSARLLQVLAGVLIAGVLALLVALGIANVQLARMGQSLAPLIEEALEEQLGRDVRIGGVRVRGLGRLDLTDSAIARGQTFAEGSALTAPRATAHVNLLSLLWRRGKDPMQAVSRITLAGPTVEVSRSRDGKWDCQDVVDRLLANEQAAGPLRAQFVVTDGRVVYADDRGFGATPQALRHEMVDVQARVTPGRHGAYAFNVSGVDTDRRLGELRLDGSYSERTGSAQVTMKANHVVAREVARYLPVKLPLTFDSGTAAFRLSALFRALPHPEKARQLSPAELTAEMELTGIGIRLNELTAPIVATSGRLRLAHDAARYPKGSRLEFINVRARAGSLPLELRGRISEINLFDAGNLRPHYDIRLTASTRDGRVLQQLFARDDWPKSVSLRGTSAIDAHLEGQGAQIRITANVRGDEISVSGMRGEGAEVRVSLVPHAAKDVPSVSGSLHVDRVLINETEISRLTATLASMTPWNALEERPVVTGEVTAGRVRHALGAVEHFRGRYSADRDALRIAGLEADILRGRITGEVTIPFRAEEKARHGLIRGSGAFAGVQLAPLGTALRLDHFTGSGDGSFAFSMPEGRLALTGSLDARNLRLNEYRASRVTSDFAVAQDREGGVTVAIPTAAVETHFGAFRIADGAYHWQGGAADVGTLRLPVDGTDIPLRELTELELTGTARLRGTVSGAIASPRLDGHLTARDGAYLGRAYRLAEADVSWVEGGTRLRNVVFSKPGMVMQVSGKDGAEIDPAEGLTGISARLTLDGAPLDDLLTLIGRESPWPIEGKTRGLITFGFTPEGTAAEGSIDIPRARVHIPRDAGAYVLPLDLLGLTFAYHAGTTRVQDLRLARGASAIHAAGAVDSRHNDALLAALTFRGTQARLQELPLDLFGIPFALHGPVTLQGTLAGPVGNTEAHGALVTRISANSPALRVEGIPAGTGAIELTYTLHGDQRDLTIHHGAVEGSALRLTSTGRYDLTRRVMDNAVLALERADLATLRTGLARTAGENGALDALLRGLPGDLAGEARGRLVMDGPFARPAVSTEFQVSRLNVNRTPLPDITGRLSAKTTHGRYTVHIDELTARDARGQASLRGHIEPDGRVDLRFLADLRAEPLAELAGGLPVSGRIGLEGAVRGPWKAPAVDADVTLAQPVIAGFAAHRVSGHLRLARERVILSNGQAWLLPDSPPLALRGDVPLRWEGMRPSLPEDRPLSLEIELPRQRTAGLDPLLPGLGMIDGHVAGSLRIGGTAEAPRLTEGRLSLDGSAALPTRDAALPNRLREIDLRLRARAQGRGSVVTLDHFSATLDRMAGNARAKGFQPGWIAGEGEVRMAAGELLSPQRWQWDVYTKILRAPLVPSVTLVPNISGFLHLGNDARGPVLKGVLLAEHAKLKEPAQGGGAAQLGPFAFNPRLSVVLHVGEGVRLAKSIFRIPLRQTPLPVPAVSSLLAGGNPSTDIARNDPAYTYHAGMLNPGVGTEVSGSWGVITGTLEDPRLYARFEVDKGKLGFPLSLIDSVRNAKGHVTFSMTDGPRIVMGIPDFPAEPPASAAKTAPPAVTSLR